MQQEQSRTYILRREREAQRGSLNGVVLNRLSRWVEFMETKTDMISAWWNSHSCVTDSNQETKEQVVTSAVEVTVTGEDTSDVVAREGL